MAASPDTRRLPMSEKKIKTIKDLVQSPDKSNPRMRTPRGKRVIEHSLRTLGAGRSILADENGKIIAGNGTAEAAIAVGITKVRVIPTDGKELIVVQRSDLSEKQKLEMSIADNQASALGEWNPDLSEMAIGMDLEPYFTTNELDGIAGDAVSSFQEMELKPPPNVIWLLVCVDMNAYGAVLPHIQALEANAKIIVKTTRDAKDRQP